MSLFTTSINLTPSFKLINSVFVQEQKNIIIIKPNIKKDFGIKYLSIMKISLNIKKKTLLILAYIFLQIIILSIITVKSGYSYANELTGFNKLFKIFNNNNAAKEKLNQKDEIQLIGISKGGAPLILLKINGGIFEIQLGQDKFNYKLLEIKKSSVIISKNMEKFEIRIGDKPILVNVKNSVFTSNLSSSQKSNNMMTNNEFINLELQNFKKNVSNELAKLDLNNFEKEITNEIINTPGRSDAGRLGFVVPENIMQQPVNKYGLKKGDIILTINNIPIGKIDDIFDLYTNNDIKTYFIEIKRSNSLITVEWYR